jgi:molybdopterin synthase catalytic subunit
MLSDLIIERFPVTVGTPTQPVFIRLPGHVKRIKGILFTTDQDSSGVTGIVGYVRASLGKIIDLPEYQVELYEKKLNLDMIKVGESVTLKNQMVKIVYVHQTGVLDPAVTNYNVTVYLKIERHGR